MRKGNEKKRLALTIAALVLVIGIVVPGCNGIDNNNGDGNGGEGVASFSVSNLKVSPASELLPNERVHITVTVTNTSSIHGSHNLNLNINGTQESSKSVTLYPASSRDVIFSLSRQDVGIYSFSIGDLSGSFTVALTLEYLLEHITTYEVFSDVEYGRIDDYSLLCNVYQPDEPIISPMPALVWIHGGRPNPPGSKDKPWSDHWSSLMASHGFFVIAIDYRSLYECQFPDEESDTKCAVRWLRAHAEEYNIDPDRIGVYGHSGGGLLSVMVGCLDDTPRYVGNGGWEEYSSRVEAVVALDKGPSDYVAMHEDTEHPPPQAFYDKHNWYLGGTIEEAYNYWWEASAVNHVTPDDPPLLMFDAEFGGYEGAQEERMYQAYQNVGLEVTLVVVANADHGFNWDSGDPTSPAFEEIEQMILEFFLTKLILEG